MSPVDILCNVAHAQQSVNRNAKNAIEGKENATKFISADFKLVWYYEVLFSKNFYKYVVPVLWENINLFRY